jgi:F-type H+-transporting ATPase subunit b
MLTFQWSTLIFQLLNFFILLGVLTWFFYRPLLRVMQQREDMIASRLRDAAEQARQVSEERQRLAEESRRIHTDAEALLAKARVAASQSRDHILERTREEVVRLMEDAKQRIQEQERLAEHHLESRLRHAVVIVAGGLIREAAGSLVHQALLQRLIEEQVGDDRQEVDLLRQALATTGYSVTVELAYPPSPDLEQHIQGALGKALGKEPLALNLAFRVEPSLIAGVRMLVGTVAVDLSLRRMLEELSQEEGSREGNRGHGMGNPA